MQLLTPAGGGAKAREMAVLRSRFKIEGFWQITEPEIARAFEGRDYAFFDVPRIGNGELGYQEYEVIPRVEDEDW
jgi:hypothetical protein